MAGYRLTCRAKTLKAQKKILFCAVSLQMLKYLKVEKNILFLFFWGSKKNILKKSFFFSQKKISFKKYSISFFVSF